MKYFKNSFSPRVVYVSPVAALLELWDFDQECPNGSGEEDDEENKALGPVTEDTKPPPRKDEQPMDVIEIE